MRKEAPIYITNVKFDELRILIYVTSYWSYKSQHHTKLNVVTNKYIPSHIHNHPNSIASSNFYI